MAAEKVPNFCSRFEMKGWEDGGMAEMTPMN
jgi:hypothetical protein